MKVDESILGEISRFTYIAQCFKSEIPKGSIRWVDGMPSIIRNQYIYFISFSEYINFQNV